MTKTTSNQGHIEAIVLQNTPYRENDMLVHVYSLEYGKISLLSRGMRKMTSKNAPGCYPITLSQFDVIIKKGVSTLIRAQLKDNYRYIKEDIDSEVIANVILEYFYRYVEENKPSAKGYEFLKLSLDALNNGYSPLTVYLIFLVYVMHNEGVNVEVDHCLYCSDTKVVSISLEGGFVCQKHSGDLEMMDPGLLMTFRHLNKCSIKDIDKVSFKESDLKKLKPIFQYYVEEYAGIHFKSQVFVDQLY